MSKFYFTFGTSKHQPFYRGYIIINALDKYAAKRLFRSLYPDANDNTLNCAGCYTQEAWNKSGMANGEWGECHAEFTYGE